MAEGNQCFTVACCTQALCQLEELFGFVPGEKLGKTKLPDQYDQSPISKLSGTEVEANLDDFHPFGSPVYVLEQALQSQQSHTKWTDRSRVGIFLCHSPNHSSSVPLVLNTQTGNVSPQFHCIFDDDFSSCKTDARFQSLWQQKAKLHIKHTVPKKQDILPTQATPFEEANLPAPDAPIPRFVTQWEDASQLDASSEQEELEHASVGSDTESPHEPETGVQAEQIEESPAPVHTRSGRLVRPNPRYFNEAHANTVYLDTYSSALDQVNCILQPVYSEEPHPMALVSESIFGFAVSSDPDTMTLDEALREPDRDHFIEAMHKELGDHINRKHWKVVPKHSIP
jgi:hypothetical protein